jgi:hypothetical protein
LTYASIAMVSSSPRSAARDTTLVSVVLFTVAFQ